MALGGRVGVQTRLYVRPLPQECVQCPHDFSCLLKIIKISWHSVAAVESPESAAVGLNQHIVRVKQLVHVTPLSCFLFRLHTGVSLL